MCSEDRNIRVRWGGPCQGVVQRTRLSTTMGLHLSGGATGLGKEDSQEVLL